MSDQTPANQLLHLVFGGELLAMKEDSPCLVMDKATLETDGYTYWDGELALRTTQPAPAG